MSLTIRPATRDDLHALGELYRQLQPHDPPWSSETAAAEALARVLDHPGVAIFIGEISSRAVATCMLIVSPNFSRGGRPFAMIDNVVTDRDYRQRGYGRQVLQHAIDAVRVLGCYRITLMTGSKREETLRFYEGAGLNRGTKTAFEVRFL
jgi:GNAT superfamily N-acetyltransferase